MICVPPKATLIPDQLGMAREEVFCLKWNDHNSNMKAVLCNLLRETSFCDITLAAGGQCIQAHRVVLIACSEYFKTLLTPLREGQHPLIILERVNFKELKSLLEYMYYGEISIRYFWPSLSQLRVQLPFFSESPTYQA